MVFEVEVFKVFLLVVVRFSGLIMTAPVIGSRNFPTTAKIGLVGLTAMLITPAIGRLDTPIPDDAVGFALYGMGELLIGIVIGFVMTLTFAAIQVAGQILDMMSGFSLINVFNPALETQVPIFGFFLFLLAALYLLVLDAHHLMIRALAASFETIPLGGFQANPALLWEVSSWGRAMFYDGIMIAAPAVGALLLAYLTMGLLSRLIPQVHLFVVGFPVTIAMALLLVAISLTAYLSLLDGMFERMFENVGTAIRGMA
ncbi:MAG: flagellar biosynthetic protein FliR [Candidatus Hydrogenedentes bacterium]|nr:flagellar biosynthetic protein FliR [Candidatus Hydrogenedentota bacterium]